ncbi:MAG: restriction endonuclease subunit S, partial [Oscillospiraceae bacterium]|nr:restriction endonuclease subunit S [Oscillospiraceae bacterium]
MSIWIYGIFISSSMLSASRNLPYAFCEQIGKEIRDISEEVPFEIPDSWEWCRFGNAMVNRDSERIPLSVAEREKLDKIYDYYGASGVIDKVDKFLFNKPLLLIGEDGANLLLRSKPIAFIAKGEYWVNNHAHVLDTVGGLFMEYISVYINAINLSPYVTGTAQPKMNQEKMNSILVPIPPLEEQHRIVTKIEELLPYIEKYAQAETQLTALNTSFPEALKKSILQEAVQGRLVPQDPDDEPVSILLERIRAEKQALIKAGKIKHDKHESVIITRDKIPYEIIDGKERCIADEVPFEI